MAKRSFLRLVLAMAVIFVLTCCLTACGGMSKDEEAVRETVDNTFAVFKNPESNDISEYVDAKLSDQLKANGMDVTQFLTAAFSHLSYEIEEVKIEDNVAEVQMEVSNVNLDTAMEAALEDFSSWSNTEDALTVYEEGGEQGLYRKLFEILYAKIDEMAESPSTIEVSMFLKKNGSTWDALDDDGKNDAFYTALYGGATFSFEDEEAAATDSANAAAKDKADDNNKSTSSN